MPAAQSLDIRRQLSLLGGVLKMSAARIVAFDDATLACQVRLATIPAPTGAENVRAAAVANAFRDAGCTTNLDAAGNVIATFPGSGGDAGTAPVVCMAHLDTVFEADTPLHVTQNGPHFCCPGIGDNGRGLAAMLTLARIFNENNGRNTLVRRRLEFVATVGEEGLGNLRGARAYFADRMNAGLLAPDAVLVLDGPGDQNVVHHALGSRRYRVTFRGAGGHSWADYGSPNAIHAASRAAAWLADVPRRLNGRVALTVSGIGGGESMNAIPAHAFVEVDVRATDHELLLKVDNELRELVRAAAHAELSSFQNSTRASAQFGTAISAFQYDIALLGERPCGVLPGEHRLVQLAREASRLHNIEPISAIASTDANIPLSLGIPAITVGGGGTGGGAHTLDEWYDNTNGPRGVARAFTILAALTA